MSATHLVDRVRSEYARTSVHPLRACQLCTHARQVEAGLQCGQPVVAGALLTVPCTQARKPGGGCGPDATHQNWPHLEHAMRVRPTAVLHWVAP